MNEKNGEECGKTVSGDTCGKESRVSILERQNRELFEEVCKSRNYKQAILNEKEVKFKDLFEELAAANKVKLLDLVSRMKNSILIEISKGKK